MRTKVICQGETEAKASIGKCFIYNGEIGEVIRAERPRGRDYFNVIFRTISHHIPDRYFKHDGIHDGFTEQNARIIKATWFSEDAREVDRAILEKAKAICKRAGEEIDNLIDEQFKEQ